MFSAVRLTKNADFDKYGYSGYGIGFDRNSRFSFANAGFDKNVIIFGVDMSSSVHVDNKKKDILILEKGPTQGLEAESVFFTKALISFLFAKFACDNLIGKCPNAKLLNSCVVMYLLLW